MTPATRAAIDGIGLSSATMQQELRNGTISVFDAIQQISNRLAQLPPQSTEVGTAIADIFRGAGEDAGLEYITMLGTAEMSLEKLKAGAGENAVAQEKLLEANQKLNKAWGELMGTGTGTFDAIKAFAIDLAATGISKVAMGIADVRDWFIELYNESLPVRAGFQYMIASWTTGFNIVKTALQSLWQQLKLGGQLIKAILTFDLSGIKDAFQEYGDNMRSAVVQNAQNVAGAWKNAWENTLNGELKPVKQRIETEIATPAGTFTPAQSTGDETGSGESAGTRSPVAAPPEMESIGDPRIVAEETFTETVLEQSKLRQHALDTEQKAAEQRAAVEQQLQQQKRDAYLTTLDTIINVFGQESAIGKAALMAKQAYAIAETIINIAKGTGQNASAVPFPANIPLLIGFAAQVAGLIGTIKSATGKTKSYAKGKYPVTADDGKTYNTKWAGKPKTGYYDGPHLGVFNEVPGQKELVVDGITSRRIELNYPEIRDAIFAVRDGIAPNYTRNLKSYADGKYPEGDIFSSQRNLNSSIDSATGQLVADAVIQLKDEIKRFQTWKPKVYTELIKRDLDTLHEIEQRSGL
jgi:hypothetical protein